MTMYLPFHPLQKLACCFALVWLLAGCSQPDPYTAVSADEAKAFGKKWVNQVAKGNEEKAAAMFSQRAFAKEMAQYNFYELSQYDIETLANNFDLDEIVDNIQREVQQGGHYRYIGHFTKDGRQYVRIRQYGRAILGYYELMLVKEDEEVKVADILAYHSGQHLSALYMQEARYLEKSGSSHQARYFEELRRRMIYAGSSGEPEAVLDMYNQLPLQLQRQQRLNYLALMSSMSADSLQKAEELYDLYCANNHTRTDRHLINIQYGMLQGRHTDALASIDSIGLLTGDDKWLVFYKGVASLYCGQLDAAANYLQQSLKNNRDFGDNYLYLAQLMAMKQRWPEARVMLQRYRSHADFSGTQESDLVAAFPQLEEPDQ